MTTLTIPHRNVHSQWWENNKVMGRQLYRATRAVPAAVWNLRDRRLKTENVIRRRTIVTTQQLSTILADLTELHVSIILFLLLRTVLLLATVASSTQLRTLCPKKASKLKLNGHLMASGDGEYSYPKLSKSGNWFSSHSQKCWGCFNGTQCNSDMYQEPGTQTWFRN